MKNNSDIKTIKAKEGLKLGDSDGLVDVRGELINAIAVTMKDATIDGWQTYDLSETLHDIAKSYPTEHDFAEHLIDIAEPYFKKEYEIRQHDNQRITINDKKIRKALAVLKSGTINPIIIADMAGVLEREYSHMETMIDTQEAHVEELIADNQWISVEKFPEKKDLDRHGRALILLADGFVTTCVFADDKFIHPLTAVSIIGWQPLPSPPEKPQ